MGQAEDSAAFLAAALEETQDEAEALRSTLAAVRAERDRAEANVAEARRQREQAYATARAAQEERDAARADLEELRIALNGVLPPVGYEGDGLVDFVPRLQAYKLNAETELARLRTTLRQVRNDILDIVGTADGAERLELADLLDRLRRRTTPPAPVDRDEARRTLDIAHALALAYERATHG